VTDAYAHCKFIGYAGDAAPLFEAAGLSRLMDDGFVSLDQTAARFHLPVRRAAVLVPSAQHGRWSGSVRGAEPGRTKTAGRLLTE